MRNISPSLVYLITMDHAEISDNELVARITSGDTDAFRDIIQRYQRPVYQLAYRMVMDPFEAEDLLQVVMVQVYKNLYKFNTSGSFRAWIFTIARNSCLNEIRRRNRKPVCSLDQMADKDDATGFQVVDEVQPDANAVVLQDELVDILNRVLSEVPEKQRTALLLFQNENLSYEEISKVLGCSLGATKSLIFRAREHLKARMQPYLAEGHWSPAVLENHN